MHIIWLCERKSGIDMDNFIDFFHIALILITSRDSGLQTDIGHGVQGAARQPLRIRKRVRMSIRILKLSIGSLNRRPKHPDT